MTRLTPDSLKWIFVAGIGALLVAFDLLRQRETPSGTLATRLLVDVALLASVGALVGLFLRAIARLRPSPEGRYAELLALHEAILDISGELDVDVVLQKVVDRARRLLNARYGALAVYAADGSIDRFLTSGLGSEERRRLGAPPVGKGLFAVVLRGGESLRLRDLGSHPNAAGFPPGHPPMRSLLAVPILSRSPWRGNLYLADKEGKPAFDAEDERTLQRFAAQAALAIDAAHLHRQVRGLAIAEERQRIAHEMHDGLAQVLASVITGTQAVREYLRAGRIDEATNLLDQLRAAADTTYTETREGILALRAAGGGNGESIDRILQDYVLDWQDRTGIDAGCSFDSGLALSSATELQLVRIVQEALSNVRRHSGATRVEIAFREEANGLLLTVHDDGRGFDPEAGTRSAGSSFGLSTMRERAQSIGGRLEIVSGVDAGTRVELRLPKSSAGPRGEIDR
jgi:signal transduction histidine kinase